MAVVAGGFTAKSMQTFTMDTRIIPIQLDRLVNISLSSIFRSLGRRLVDNTPFDTGKTKMNWYPSFGAGPRQRRSPTLKASTPEAAAAIVEKRTFVKSFDFTKNAIFWWSNWMNHILLLEFGGYEVPKRFSGSNKRTQQNAMWAKIREREERGIRVRRIFQAGGGYSWQAPRGIARIAVAEEKRNIDKTWALATGKTWFSGIKVTGGADEL
jgi:hypothetical protein